MIQPEVLIYVHEMFLFEMTLMRIALFKPKMALRYCFVSFSML